MEIGVYGLGRFGAFWASLLGRYFTGLKVYNRSDRPTPHGLIRCSLEEICRCDVLFLCTAISSMEKVSQQIAPLLHKDTLVVDTCSVKVLPLQTLQKNLPAENPILGSHPMFGPDSAAKGINGLPIVLSPVRLSSEQFHFWKKSFSDMGLEVLEMTAEEHDREAAYTQGVTHFVGRLLNELNLQDSSMGTKGYHALREIVTQTCNDPIQLFMDLQSFNPFTAEMRNQLDGVMKKMIERFDSIETRSDK